MTKKLCEVQAELKISIDSVKPLREEISQLWIKNKDLEADLARQESYVDQLKQQKIQLERENDHWNEKHQPQLRVNAELMKRKEQIEWELVEAQSLQRPPN